ncbi:hypothetical protein MKK50_15315 [Methylobacterium sp. J-043]|nr:hypothetical protein [Methylobacterium sp. J-043]
MKVPKKKPDDDEPKFSFELGWKGLKTSGSGSVAVVAAALLAVLAIVLVRLPFLW